MSFSMSISSTIAAPPRSFLSAHTASVPRSYSSLNPTAKPRASAQPLVDIRTHISNLDRILQKSDDASHEAASAFNLPTNTVSNRNENVSGNRIFDVLKLHGLFNRSSPADEISPRSLRKLQRLLSSPRPSPRNTIAGDWRRYHGAENWAGLLDPLDENLRRELVRYGDLVQAAYQSFYSPSSPLPDRSYRVTRILHATSSVAFLPGSLPRSSPMGYVAVCENEREVRRMGRRDIVIALRGTATCLEWVENLRAGLVPVDDDEAKVECGFLSLYKTSGDGIPSLSMSVVEEVRRLMKVYQGEELSITVTGHSLGAALAVLVADELSVAGAPPVAVFSFGGPRVGNRAFADRVGRRGVKVLRVVNAHDVVTRVPARVDEGWAARVLEGYADVGEELRVDSRVSPYLRPNADPACCHDLEAYLHLVYGFNGTCRPFRSDANRSLARLMTQQGGNVKKLYTVHARALAVDPAYAFRSNGPACLTSPSS